MQPIIKYIFTMMGSTYIYTHLLNIKLKKSNYFYHLILSLCCAPVAYIFKTHISAFTIISMVLFLAFFCNIVYKKDWHLSIYISIISFGIIYALFALAMVLNIPLLALIFKIFNDTNYYFVSDLLFLLIPCITQYILAILLFSLKRFKNGVPDIENTSYNSIGLFSSIIIIFISSLFFLQDKFSMELMFFLLFFLITASIIIYMWLRQHITQVYKNKLNQRNIDILEQTIDEQKAEIEKLSKLIHKDNKVISALELSVMELYKASDDCENFNNLKLNCEQLLKELDFLCAERKVVLSDYESLNKGFQKTGIFNIDIIINYLYKRAKDSGINFNVTLIGNVHYLTSNIIDEHALGTILSELGENAIYSSSKSKHKHILLSIGVRDNCYFLDLYDSGYNFDSKVIENLGRKRYTTRMSEGGSGIGLMNIFEILQKSLASFELEEIDDNSLYTKRVSVIWDTQSEVRIFSQREEIYTSCLHHPRILYNP